MPLEDQSPYVAVVSGGSSVGRRTLIVDDERAIREGMARLIGMHDFEPITAATIAEGLEKLSLQPSILILDMNLPDGHGTVLLRHIRDQNLPIKVAVLSGSGDASLLAEARDLQPEAMFTKPPDWDALLSWLAAA